MPGVLQENWFLSSENIIMSNHLQIFHEKCMFQLDVAPIDKTLLICSEVETNSCEHEHNFWVNLLLFFLMKKPGGFTHVVGHFFLK